MCFGRKCCRSCLLVTHHAYQLSRTSHVLCQPIIQNHTTNDNQNPFMFFRCLPAVQKNTTDTNHNHILLFRNVRLSRHLPFSPLASTLLVASSRELMANLLESTMELVGAKEWSFEALAVPQMGHVPSTEIENPITMENFLSSACRRCDGIRTTTLMFDFHPQVPQFGGFARLGELIQQGEIQDLPAPLSLNGNLPPRAKLGSIVHNIGGRRNECAQDSSLCRQVCRKQWTGTLYWQGLHSCLPPGSLGSSEGRSAPATASTRISSPVEPRAAEATVHSEELLVTMDSGF